MVRTSQSKHRGKSKALFAAAAPAQEMDRDVTTSPQGRDNHNRAGRLTDERTSKRIEGVGKLMLVPIDALRVDPRNPRKHSRIQVRAIARSIDAFRFQRVHSGRQEQPDCRRSWAL